MGQYDDKVQRQRILLAAEKWADSPQSVHVHGLKSMWYETEESVKDFENGNVTDTVFNSGLIERKQQGKLIRTFGYRLTGDALIDSYSRNT